MTRHSHLAALKGMDVLDFYMQERAGHALEQPLRQRPSLEPDPFDTETGLCQGPLKILRMAYDLGFSPYRPVSSPMQIAVSFNDTSNPAKYFTARSFPDAHGWFTQTNFYHQLEARHFHQRRRRKWGASRIPQSRRQFAETTATDARDMRYPLYQLFRLPIGR